MISTIRMFIVDNQKKKQKIRENIKKNKERNSYVSEQPQLKSPSSVNLEGIHIP